MSRPYIKGLTPEPLAAKEVFPAFIKDLAPEVLDEHGRLRILPAAFWAGTTANERALFGQRYGYYSLPTVELVERLQEIIGEQKAIEIGAGNGVLAETLGITATDSMHQSNARVRSEHYDVAGQKPVSYGLNVRKHNAYNAVRKYRPDVVLACWVTHKYDPMRHAAGGLDKGVDEEDVIANCGRYVFVGNERVHAGKSIWKLPHTIEYPDWLHSRADYRHGRNFIAVWERE